MCREYRARETADKELTKLTQTDCRQRVNKVEPDRLCKQRVNKVEPDRLQTKT